MRANHLLYIMETLLELLERRLQLLGQMRRWSQNMEGLRDPFNASKPTQLELPVPWFDLAYSKVLKAGLLMRSSGPSFGILPSGDRETNPRSLAGKLTRRVSVTSSRRMTGRLVVYGDRGIKYREERALGAFRPTSVQIKVVNSL
jgi:hypothetical protein